MNWRSYIPPSFNVLDGRGVECRELEVDIDGPVAGNTTFVKDLFAYMGTLQAENPSW